MDKVTNSIKKQSSSKSQVLEDATSGQPLNSNSVLEIKSLLNESDFQQGFSGTDQAVVLEERNSYSTTGCNIRDTIKRNVK